MSDTFYVVTTPPGADDYTAAVAFNAQHKDADNEAAANEFLAEKRVTEPWNSHAVVSAAAFDKASTKSAANQTGKD